MSQMSLDLWRSVDDLRRAHIQDAAFHGRVAERERSAERQRRELDECQTRLDTATKDLVSLESKYATSAERTAILERRLVDVADGLAEISEGSSSIRVEVTQDVQECRSTMELFGTEIKLSLNNNAKAIEDVKRTNDDNAEKLHARHVTVVGRIDLMENMLSEISETYYRMLSDLQHKHAELSSTSESIPDRVARVEQQQRDSADKLANDLQILQRSRGQFESRIADNFDALERELRDKAD